MFLSQIFFFFSFFFLLHNFVYHSFPRLFRMFFGEKEIVVRVGVGKKRCSEAFRAAVLWDDVEDEFEVEKTCANYQTFLTWT